MALVESLKSPYHQRNTVESSTIKSFQEIYKTSYSHGLENIYAMETIDLNSVRRISDAPTVAPQIVKKKSIDQTLIVPSAQLEFDFGFAYRGWMESFVLREPIQVLELSRHAEKSLLANGKLILSHLLEADLMSFIFLKGMGQGHIDEIQKKLSLYLDGRVLDKSQTVDYSAWVRSLLASFDRKKAFVCASSYHLMELFPLSLTENAEVGKLTPEKREEIFSEVFNVLRKEKQHSVTEDLRCLVDVFVRPWVLGRLGIATEPEVHERLRRISEYVDKMQNAFDFIGDVFFEKEFPVKQYLYEVEDRLYCSDDFSARNYRMVMEKAHSYFYKPTICYTLYHLVQLLTREFARNWQGFAAGFVEKVLRYSSEFRVRKNIHGDLVVSLSV